MAKKLNLQPMGTRVLIQPLEQEGKTASGLLLPETAKEKPQTGLVVAVGDAEEVVAVVDVAFGLGKELHRLQGGHEEFGGAGGVHFLPDDVHHT